MQMLIPISFLALKQVGDNTTGWVTTTWVAGNILNKFNINYKYNEGNLLEEVWEYINNTYDEHYAQGEIEATEVIIDAGHGLGFSIGNILKYGKRIGHKIDDRKDLMKIIHYAIIALYVLDGEVNAEESKETRT